MRMNALGAKAPASAAPALSCANGSAKPRRNPPPAAALALRKARRETVARESLGSQGYTVMQLMQIVGERNVRIVPDVSVTGTNGSGNLVDGLLGMMMREQNAKHIITSTHKPA